LATDRPFYKLAIDHPAAILKLFGVADGDDYTASSVTFKATENRRDLIFKNRSGKKILFVESHGYADPYVYHDLLEGMMMYCRQKKFTGDLHAGVIFLEKSHHKAASELAHHFDGHAELAFQPMVLVMNQIGLETLENLNDVRLVPLYPLCKISARQITASIPAWGERIKGAKQISIDEREELLSLLGDFVMHRVKKLALNRFNNLIGGYKMEDSRMAKEIRGIGGRDVIFGLIEYRFGSIPDEIRRRLERIYDAKRLKRIGSGLLEIKDLKQLKQLIGPNGKSASHGRNGSKTKGTAKAAHGVSR
jgi:hypothetical protein